MAKRRRRNRARVFEDVLARAARLDVTPERVLREYARIAFSNIRQIAEWDDEKGIVVKPSTGLDPDAAPAIAEIVASASNQKIYRIKMHDKKPVLDSIARHLEMLPLASGPDDHEETALDPRELLIRELDRLAAERVEGPGDPPPGC